ncbi:MAG TPA: (2Fe-2S)-binding protein [Kiritimatiellia bacterium]|nr:(2Fe-2S)-binding protein [Kiritimatiellia bacterium]HMP00778.1 (2Fe-2S)-binding protein [Kiritimatiellia bacterium]HMP96736.1 (2Fe-2S)-binding protein [Kiritimatiellia bacterium]
MKLTLTLNGKSRAIEINANDKLSDVLRLLGCASVKTGCHEGACGSCGVLLNGRIVNSCLTYAAQADGGNVETVESIGSLDAPHPIQAALVEAGAVQCGFCMPGMIMAAKSVFDKNPAPSDEELAIHLDGQLCRCTGYEKIQTALRNVAQAAGVPDALVGGQGDRS